MNEQARTGIQVAAWTIAAYYVVGLVVAYGYWTRGGEPSGASVLLALAVHVAVGAIVGRWWIALLPIVWAVLSFGAVHDGDIEASDGLFVALTVPFVWMPALLIGVAIRKLADPRGRTRRRVIVSGVVLLLLGVGYVATVSLQEDPGDRPQARFDAIDEVEGTYGGVGLGESPADVFEAHGMNKLVGNEGMGPHDAEEIDYPNYQERGIWATCYDDACFTFYKPWDPSVPPDLSHLPATATVETIEIASPGAATLRGVEVGDPLEEVENLYPELTCGKEPVYGEGRGGSIYCTGIVSRDRWIWFGGDPVNVIVLSPSGFGY